MAELLNKVQNIEDLNTDTGDSRISVTPDTLNRPDGIDYAIGLSLKNGEYITQILFNLSSGHKVLIRINVGAISFGSWSQL